MIEIKKIHKRDIPALLSDSSLWNHHFLAISKHRLLSHFHNPNCHEDDVVLLLAYFNGELAGYMGVMMDKIRVDGKTEKIGWLSTWWVDPITKGSGIGREILNTMYEAHGGRIGISQFTPSAKRVYDKSGYFNTLKESTGLKAVLRSNLAFVVPALFPKVGLKQVWNCVDGILNFFINIKLRLQKRSLVRDLRNSVIEYQNVPDEEALQFIKANSKNHLSSKTEAFFTWLKHYHWVEEAPLINLTDARKYEFSSYANKFNIYYLKISEAGKCVGFLALQRRDFVAKVLFSYHDTPQGEQVIAKVIAAQCIAQNIREIICYDHSICRQFEKATLFLYKRKKIKQSIISKVYEHTFNDVEMNFGDGDCCMA